MASSVSPVYGPPPFGGLSRFMKAAHPLKDFACDSLSSVIVLKSTPSVQLCVPREPRGSGPTPAARIVGTLDISMGKLTWDLQNKDMSCEARAQKTDD